MARHYSFSAPTLNSYPLVCIVMIALHVIVFGPQPAAGKFTPCGGPHFEGRSQAGKHLARARKLSQEWVEELGLNVRLVLKLLILDPYHLYNISYFM